MDKFKKFLNSFGENKIICVNKNFKANSPMKIVSLEEALSLNKQGHDVYFYINQGGTKEKDIKPVAFYIDLDAGKDGDMYKPLNEVRVLKKKMLNRINEFPINPSYVVETRNGYQVYWIISNHPTKETWKNIQNKLFNFFIEVGADARTKRINQIYRLPGTLWQKKWTCEKPFMTKIISNTNKVYQSSSFLNALREYSTIVVGNSYSLKPGKVSKPEKEDNTPTNTDLLTTVKQFLLDVAKVLNYSNNKFLSKSAYDLANKVSAEYCV